MAVEGRGCETATRRLTLGDVGKRADDNLRVAVELAARLGMVADHLGGSVPTDGAAKSPGAPPASSTVERMARDGEDLARAHGVIQYEIGRIEAALGVSFAPPDTEVTPLGGFQTGTRSGPGSIGVQAEDSRLYRGVAPR